VTDLLATVGRAPTIVGNVVSAVVDNFEQDLLTKVTQYLLGGTPYVEKITTIALAGLGPVFTALSSGQTALVSTRDTTWQALGGTPGGNQPGSGIGDDLSNITLEKVSGLLIVPFNDPNKLRDGLKQPGGGLPDNDYLAAERDELSDLQTKLNSGNPTNLDQPTLKALSALFADWNSGLGSAQKLAKQLSDAAALVLSGDLKRIVDLEGARRRIEEKLKELVPAKISLTYELQGNLVPVGEFFLPQPDSQITLSAAAVYDLLNPRNPPQLTATCTLDAFDVNLFDVVKLIFSGAKFVTETGKGSNFNVVYKDFELGPEAAFLQPLESLLNPGGSGPYVKPSTVVPGIEAGYSLDLGIVSIGTLSFINVSINASCTLPFDGSAATFTASLGREDSPILISCAPYIGGGFLALYATAKEMLGFAASFEFGGGGAFAFGPLSGQGRISTGVYLRKIGNDAEIDGYFYAGGDAHIACFGIGATLLVRIGQQNGGAMQGSAVFTYSFSLGFAKLRFSVGVQRSMGKGFSGVARSSSLAGTALLAAHALVSPSAAIVTSSAVAQQDDWLGYQTYFADDINGFPT
jgi:hypothetical protein